MRAHLDQRGWGATFCSWLTVVVVTVMGWWRMTLAVMLVVVVMVMMVVMVTEAGVALVTVAMAVLL